VLGYCVSDDFFRNSLSGALVPRLLAVPVHVYTQCPLCGGVGDSLDGSMNVSTSFGFGSGIDTFREEPLSLPSALAEEIGLSCAQSRFRSL
jgi:hypothetical protein